ncbi:MAG: hypothetical protein SP1CHLAM54_09390 [Chlamydiia bacterium]|nr:hypothetical protein [Chlamydiia bacterium]MCH9615845.1 hypothetical protein [Chlamydiia bacterium]MCH9628752.1 hypothetical protein [Chlamydiia bacterium]
MKSLSKSFSISKENAGERLGHAVKNHVDSSMRQVKRSIDSGGCTVNGVIEHFASRRMKVGDKVDFHFVNEVKGEMQVVFEDQYLIAYDKPAGVVCDDDALVHRLDKRTSGLLIKAKDKQTQKLMEKLFFQRKVHKEYLAFVVGEVKERKGVIETKLAKKASYDGQTVWGSADEGLPAKTEWALVESGPVSVIKCFPKTGRTHQLRVHLSEMGHPVVGDHQYGRNSKFYYPYDRHLLHAIKLRFKHPRTGEDLTLRTLVDFQRDAYDSIKA